MRGVENFKLRVTRKYKKRWRRLSKQMWCSLPWEKKPQSKPERRLRARISTYRGGSRNCWRRFSATGKPVVLLLFSGRPLTLPWAFEHVPAIVAAWFPGIQAGPALVRVLFGDVAPSGKLVVSWPRTMGQIPIYYNALNTGRPADGVDLTHPPRNSLEKYISRYIDELNSPQFPFGFGLSYSSLELFQDASGFREAERIGFKRESAASGGGQRAARNRDREREEYGKARGRRGRPTLCPADWHQHGRTGSQACGLQTHLACSWREPDGEFPAWR